MGKLQHGGWRGMVAGGVAALWGGVGMFDKRTEAIKQIRLILTLEKTYGTAKLNSATRSQALIYRCSSPA